MFLDIYTYSTIFFSLGIYAFVLPTYTRACARATHTHTHTQNFRNENMIQHNIIQYNSFSNDDMSELKSILFLF